MADNNHAKWVNDPRVKTPANDGITGDHPGWETVSHELQYDGPYAKVFHDFVRTPTRPEGVMWTVVRRKYAVAVAPRTEDGKWLLVHQERIPIRRAIWEFPAGQIENADESGENGDPIARQAVIQATAWRELREETGWTSGPASRLESLGIFYSSAGFTDEHCYLFFADGVVLHAEGSLPDEHERIVECRAFTTEELVGMIASGEIRDANTLACFARLTALKKV
ncbi:MAG TPA: NUDIX hydrolase [Chthoniobacterales bacterium]